MLMAREGFLNIKDRDSTNGYGFQTELADNRSVSAESCVILCASQNFTLAGLQHDVQCCGFYRWSITLSGFKILLRSLREQTPR